MVNNKLITLAVAIVISLVNSAAFSAANDNQSSQQALQQLRMLQQRLAQNDNNSANSSVSKPANSATINNKSTTSARTDVPTIASAHSDQNQSGSLPLPDENETIDDKAFEAVKRQLFPLTPEQIVRLKQLYNNNELAGITSAGAPPKPTATSQLVNLSPGSTPPVIRLAQGFVSSLVFLDSTGAPWPISAYDLGDPASFNIQWDKTGNTLMIQAVKLYNYGNLAVRLKGLNTPVMLTLIPGQKAVDYRVDLRIQGVGPMAVVAPETEGLPASANDILLHVLDGVPPAGSQRLTVSGGDARAWAHDNLMYVRTNLTILSPGWLASMTSADGMHAYEIQKSPVLLVSWHGKVLQLKVEGL